MSFDEWGAVQRLLGRIHGVSTAPPANIVTSMYTSGALLGNGEVGVVVGDSSAARQTYHFGKADFWGNRNPVRHNAPECNWNCGASILSLGSLSISSPAEGNGVVSGYRMDQDILHGQVTTDLRFGDTTVHLRSWIADGSDLFVTEVFSEGGDATGLPMEISLMMPGPEQDPHASFPGAVGAENSLLWASRENGAVGPKDYSAREAIAVRLLGADFKKTENKTLRVRGRFLLKAHRPVRIVAAFESDARMGLDGPSTAALVKMAMNDALRLTPAQVGKLKTAHTDWWKQFWLRSFVELHDPVLEAYYYGALYVLGSTVREKMPAPSMFGNFITTDDVAWGGIYFMNYNEEAPYYGAFSSNHAEIARPYNRMVLDQIPWQKNITAAAGYKGVSFQRVFALYTSYAKPPQPVKLAERKNLSWLPADQKSNATFSFLPAIQYYEYTLDGVFLRDQLYPALKELDAFWRDYATRDAAGRQWIFEHSAAHEGGNDLNPNLDIGFARRVERELIETSRVLGVDAEMRPVWQSFLDQLSPYPTGIVNGKTVYLIASSIHNQSEDHGLFEPGDQPINLEGVVFPGENLAVGGSPLSLKIARDSMEEMHSWSASPGPNSENGFCKIFPIAARIGWPADDLVNKFRAAIRYLWRPSNLTVAQGGGGIESSGAIEAVDSMLLQHEDGVLRVFPAWPTSMDASFTRLRAKGAFLVSSDQRGGAVQFIDIVSEYGGILTIQSPWGGADVLDSDGQARIKPNDRGQIELSTQPGGHYHLLSQ